MHRRQGDLAPGTAALSHAILSTIVPPHRYLQTLPTWYLCIAMQMSHFMRVQNVKQSRKRKERAEANAQTVYL